MSLQSEGYPEAFSNLDDQLLIILTKETKLLEKNAPIYRYHAPLRILFWLNNWDPFREVKIEVNEWFSFKIGKTKYEHQTKTLSQAIY